MCGCDDEDSGKMGRQSRRSSEQKLVVGSVYVVALGTVSGAGVR